MTNRTLGLTEEKWCHCFLARFTQFLTITSANWGADGDRSTGFQPAEAKVHSYTTLHPLKLWSSLADPEFNSNARGYTGFPWNETFLRAVNVFCKTFLTWFKACWISYMHTIVKLLTDLGWISTCRLKLYLLPEPQRGGTNSWFRRITFI